MDSVVPSQATLEAFPPHRIFFFTELVMSEGDGDDDAFIDVEDDGVNDGDDRDGLADNTDDMDTADPSAQSSSSAGFDSIAFQFLWLRL